MLLIPTSVRASGIHGNGLFASEPVVTGTAIWRFAPKFDLTVDATEIMRFPVIARKHAFNCWGAVGPTWLLFGDHAGFINHSAEPNLVVTGSEIRAAHDIPANDELVLDYSQVDFANIVK